MGRCSGKVPPGGFWGEKGGFWHLVEVRLVEQVARLGLGVVVVRGQDPGLGFLLVHLPVAVFVAELHELLAFRLHPLGFVGVAVLAVHVT